MLFVVSKVENMKAQFLPLFLYPFKAFKTTKMKANFIITPREELDHK